MKIDKNILNAAKIAACRELFVKYNGKSHTKIEAEMRDLGFTDFSRRILYARTRGTGQRAGWIAEFGWAATLAGNAAALGCKAGSSSLTGPPSSNLHRSHAGGTGVAGEGACVPGVPDFQTWLKRVSPGMTWDWRHQLIIYDHLKRITNGENNRLMIFMPPRHGKSELVTVRYSAWRMRRDPAMKIILASYGQQLANTFSRSIKRVICDDVALSGQAAVGSVPPASGSVPPAVAGGVLVPHGATTRSGFCEACRPNTTDTEKRTTAKHRVSETDGCRFEQLKNGGLCVNCNAELPVANTPPATAGGSDANVFPFATQRPINTAAQWGTTLGGGLRAVGVGGGVTGFGADLIVIDDPVKNRAQAESERYRERVWEWYNDDLYTRLEPNAAMILIQTRWHEDDLAGRLIKQMNEGGEKWEIVDLPALAEETGARARNSPPYEGGVAAASADGVVFPAGDETSSEASRSVILQYAVTNKFEDPQPENHPAAEAAPLLRKEGGSRQCKPKVIGFPRLYSHVNDWSAGHLLANSGSTAVTEPRNEDLVMEHSTSHLTAASENTRNLSDAKPHHAGGTGVAGEGACVPVVFAGGTGVGEQDARPPVGPPVGLPVDWRVPGDALCPERYDIKKLEKIRSQLGMYGFSALYQQKPTPPDGAIFKRDWLRNIVEAAPPGLRWYRGYDLAISTKTTADYTASFRVAIDELGFLYIADGFRERIEYPEQRRFIMERIRTERNTLHGIEDSAHGKAIIQDLRRETRMRGYAFKPVPVVGDKLTRALKWSPIAEEGKLRLVRGAWIKPFINELIRFPMGKHDDQTDAVSIAVHMMAETPDNRLHRF
ncbi:MAG: phage terminase large subunit [Pyrinomonadaceae bacterium]